MENRIATRDEIVEALRTVKDPEIFINIWDMGFVYRLDISDEGDVDIDMTLTSPACPLADQMPLQARDAVAAVARGRSVAVNLVCDPPWTPDRMTDEARFEMDLF